MQKKTRNGIFVALLLFVAVSIPIGAYFIIVEDSFDLRDRAAPGEFNFDTYRGMARFGAGKAVDMFSEGTLSEWEDFQFGWYHNWRIFEGDSHSYVDGLPTTDAPPSVVFSGIISPGWDWAEPTMAGCDTEVKEELANYEDGEIIWVGNEAGWGDNRDPTTYAESYKGWYDCIKSVNENIKVSPTAFNPLYKYAYNMSNWTNSVDTMNPGDPRWDANEGDAGDINFIQYLTYAKEDYESLYGEEMPIDAYVIHLYNLYDDHEDTDVTGYVNRIKNELLAFRQYMKDNGEERLSLSVKEFGFLYGAGVDSPFDSFDYPGWSALSEKMVAILDMFNTSTDTELGNPNDGNRLVQRWTWFVGANPDPCAGAGGACGWHNTSLVHCPQINGHSGQGSNCFDARTITPLGEAYVEYIATIVGDYDTSPPAAPEVTYDLDGTTVTVSFESTDNGTINDYEISLGTAAGVADIELWKSTNTATTYTFSDAVDKYVNVKAIDDGYNWSDVGSILIEEDAPCTPDCEGKECGDDGCGDVCDTCPDGETCSDAFVCVDDDCVPDCEDKECGDDGCGDVCDTCPEGETCNDSFVCVEGECSPDCDGKDCGDDGCDDVCGVCDSGMTCNHLDKCVLSCTPSCAGKECGSDGCGGSCSTCPSGEVCNVSGICVSSSTPVSQGGTTDQSGSGSQSSTDTGTGGTGYTSSATGTSESSTDSDSYSSGTSQDSSELSTLPETGIFDYAGWIAGLGGVLIVAGVALVFFLPEDKRRNVIVLRGD